MSPAASECADGTICPSGTACVVLDGAYGCLLPTCGNGRVDPGEACDDGNHASGDGCRFDCRAPCGDGVLDLEELCDDGNRVDGDGCSADCLSDETCGNGITDGITGEECDDLGGLRSGDGCSSVCELESASWRGLDRSPGPRVGHAMAYDAARGRTVLFGGCAVRDGGCAGGLMDDTWEWDGVEWVERSPVHKPSVRAYHAMAYDAARKVVVLVGGCTSDSPVPLQCSANDELWEWDGRDWTQRVTGAPLGQRAFHALAYDAARHVTVLYGGRDGADQTWEWDGATWTLQQPVATPGPRVLLAMAYDATRERVVLFGGAAPQPGEATHDDVWEWDGARWHQRATTISPPARVSHAMVYDPRRGAVVVVGGCATPTLEPASMYRECSNVVSDTWAWNGTQWTQLTPVTTLPARMNHAAAYDTARGQVLVLGGEADTQLLDETWVLDDTTWTQLRPVKGPEARLNRSLVYDSRRGVLVMVGGEGQPYYLDDTWEWDEGWKQRITGPGPSPRRGAAIAYDAARDCVVLFGGVPYDDSWRETWELDANGWQLRASGEASPPARFYHSMAYDPVREVVWLFGGIGPFADLWKWNGAVWERVDAVGPSARGGATMTYDAARDRIVVIGGSTTEPSEDLEVWEWDGASWSERTVSGGPPARVHHAAAYDPTRHVTVIFGGNSLTNGNFLDDTWEWDGSAWRARVFAVEPSARALHAMAYDPISAQIVMFGGAGATSAWNDDTWLFDLQARDEDREVCTSGDDVDRDGVVGCADPDCAGRCAPSCAVYGICDPSDPHCGDGTCSALEDCRVCPSDCACTPVCGDFHCDAGETCATCGSDCPC